MFSGYAAYRVDETSRSSIDLAAGFRAYDMQVDGALNTGGGASVPFGGSESWVDPIIAIRGNWALSEKWLLTGFADIGGFGVGSDLTWQVMATFDYQLNDSWALRFGYRYLEIDKPVGGNDLKTGISGPIFGATYRF